MWINANAYANYRTDVEHLKQAHVKALEDIEGARAEVRDLRKQLKDADVERTELKVVAAIATTRMEDWALTQNELRLRAATLEAKLYNLDTKVPMLMTARAPQDVGAFDYSPIAPTDREPEMLDLPDPSDLTPTT